MYYLSLKTFINHKKYFSIFTLLGVIIYFPIFLNGFVWDDFPFIIDNSQIHHFNLFSLFSPSLFNNGNFYRPIPAVYFSLLYSLFGTHAFFYHFIQLSLHILCVSIFFIYLCTFFSKNISFFIALIFLVSPINVESVAFIGATQSELYFLPGIISLLIAQKKDISNKRFFLIFGLLFISALTKETGILFFLLVLLYRYLFKLGRIKDFLYGSVVTALWYILFRVVVGSVKFSIGPTATSTWLHDFINIPPIIFYYLKTFLFPMDLAVWQEWSYANITYQHFILPFLVCLLFVTVSFWFGYYLSKKTKKSSISQKRHKQYLFFSFWFLIGMGILIHIFPLDMTVADRWFYFPLVGILGMLGVAIQEVAPIVKKQKNAFLSVAVIIILLFSLRTCIRNFDYKDNKTLYAHDTKNQMDDMVLMDAYFQILLKENKKDVAKQYLQRVLSNDKNSIDMKKEALNDLRILENKRVQNIRSTKLFNE